MRCAIPCEKVRPVIEEKFYRTRDSVIYDSAYIKNVPRYDTTFTDTTRTTIERIDTSYFLGANLCIGDGVIFKGHGEYSYETGYYYPTDSTSFFKWTLTNAGDSAVGLGVTSVYYEYKETGCNDVVLNITDTMGCPSTEYTTIRVRTSRNPIKTIFTLMDICNRDSLMVNIGYSGENATLTLREIEENKPVSKINDARTFLPDGQPDASYCPPPPPGETDPKCFRAPVTFTEFPSGRRIQDKEDICSICINMEHSFMGDVTVSIVCPTGQEAHFFVGTQDATVRNALYSAMTGGQGGGGSSSTCCGLDGGGGQFMGYPLDDYGAGTDGSPKCDSMMNPYGVGMDYCFTRNGAYTLVTGDRANISGHPDGDFYITNKSATYRDSYSNIVFPPIPSYFTNQCTPAPTSGSTKRPSNHEDKYDYYLPFTDFRELIGCPLNGDWCIRVCDKWGADNGWLFNWSMDICGVSQDDDCKYTVGIDSLIWKPNPDSIYHDYDLGHYRGLNVHRATPTISYILSPDTAGTFPIDVYIYDEFGCVWDTNTRITTYWTPQPSLGNDTSLCGVESFTLDAKDRHTATQCYNYKWEPFGQTTDTIHTATWQKGQTTYVVEVTNTQANTRCTRRDTINVAVLRQPIPGYMPSVLPLEGCSPMTVTFENLSIDGDYYFWDFGDGITSELKNPTHSYATGVYDFKYYVRSSDGCIDSLIYPEHIAVYDAPTAAFSWDPVYPSALNPTIHLTNNTSPKTDYTDYFWEVQYNRDNPLSVETILDEDAEYTFTNLSNEIAGNYAVRLIARTRNIAPSGNIVYCRDTAENSVMVVNDYLQFPNVVTPNGDGINDLFIIKNLVEGMAYPNNALYIYNKWGTQVYHKENISRMEDFWDPSNVPTGTYFYRFTAQGYNGNIEHNGSIEVIL